MILIQLNKYRSFSGRIMHDILDVIKNIKEIYESNSSLAVLKDFERVIDEMDIYVYDNWLDGELLYGPSTQRHWVTAGFMWPRDKMPDPLGGKRLTDLGCKVTYKKSIIVQPRKIKTPDDIRPGTKKGKLDNNPIWVVEISMPRKLVFDVYKGYMAKLREELNGNSEELKSATPAPMDAGATAAAGNIGAPAAPAAAAPGAPA